MQYYFYKPICTPPPPRPTSNPSSHLHNGSELFVGGLHDDHGFLAAPAEHTLHPGYPHPIYQVPRQTEGDGLWCRQCLALLKRNTWWGGTKNHQ